MGDQLSMRMFQEQNKDSLANLFQMKSVQSKKKLILSLTDEECDILHYTWDFWARKNQLPPNGKWVTWAIIAGRGFGKTRTGSEWVNYLARNELASRIALVGPTAADVRDVMIQGESGIIETSGPWEKPIYNPSKRLVTWPNGVKAFAYSGDEPERLRGPQHSKAWVDEYCSFRYPHAVDMLDMGLRLGDNPQKLVTTTPKPTKSLKKLLSQPDTVTVTGSTYDNESNLPPSFIKQILGRYEGTRLGRQELYAEILAESEDALWTRNIIDEGRVIKCPELEVIIIGVDPTVSSSKTSDECGIVVAGKVGNSIYVIDDATIKASPEKWARRVVAKYHQYSANKVVPEVNNGGDLVTIMIKNIDLSVKVSPVHASRGKYARAEPVSALYEQGKVHHVGYFEKLEEQMCTYSANSSSESPDRMDALVWAITHLFNKRKVSTSAFF